MDNQGRIKLEAVSFETLDKPRVKYGLALPDGQSISVEVSVVPPNDSVAFNSYDQIMALARLKLSTWLEEMARQHIPG